MSKGGLTPDLKILRGEEFSRSGSYMFIGRRSRRGVSVLEAASADLWIIRGRKDEPRHAQLQRAGALCLTELMGPGLKCAHELRPELRQGAPIVPESPWFAVALSYRASNFRTALQTTPSMRTAA